MTSTKDIFGSIALSLSGGGYRAAAFHLGTLEMLEELGLLQEVKYLSTVSGGSIIGAYYAACLNGKSFDEFKTSFESFLYNNAVRVGLDNLRSEPFVKVQGQMPSLIRATAYVYDSKDLLDQKTFAHIRLNPGHLEELTINATELRGGGSFRFIHSSNPRVHSGNNDLAVDDDTASKIRIADAVAASSCFPGGFEPIRFPTDFVWPDGMTADEIKGNLGRDFLRDVPLMDGGIFDNQGIESIKNVLGRVGTSIGLFIISDTSQRNFEPYDLPPEQNKGIIPLMVWRWLIAALGLLAILSVALTLADHGPRETITQLGPLRAALTYFLPLAVLTALFLMIFVALWGTRKLRGYVREKTGIDIWKSLRLLSAPQVLSLVKSRLNSVLELTTATFMTRIRLLGYRQMFSNPANSGKLLPNLIYDIDNESEWVASIRGSAHEPKDGIRQKIKTAEAYKTNLWFLDAADLRNLILSGRATIVFKLLTYMLEHKGREIMIDGSPEKIFFDDVAARWRNINQ